MGISWGPQRPPRTPVSGAVYLTFADVMKWGSRSSKTLFCLYKAHSLSLVPFKGRWLRYNENSIAFGWGRCTTQMVVRILATASYTVMMNDVWSPLALLQVSMWSALIPLIKQKKKKKSLLGKSIFPMLCCYSRPFFILQYVFVNYNSRSTMLGVASIRFSTLPSQQT